MFKKDKKKYKIVLAVFGLLIFLNFIGLLNPVNSFLSYGVDFLAIKMRLKTVENLDLKQSKKDLLDKIKQLQNDLAKEKTDMVLLEELKRENSELRSFLDFFEENNFNNYLLSDVIWQDNLLNFSKPNSNLIINKGKNDGLVEGLAVVNNNGILVGKIIEVDENYSKLCLLTNDFCKLAVSVSNEDQSFGLAEGDLGLSIKINFIPQNESVLEGDIVFSSGLERSIPKGLYVGEVIDIDKKENDIWQEVRVRPFFDLKDLNRLAVILID